MFLGVGQDKDIVCEHCHTLIRGGQPIYPSEQGNSFCCTGCRAIYAAIRQCQLTDYYQIRDQFLKSTTPALEANKNFKYLDSPEIVAEFVEEESQNQIYFFIANIQCAACVWILEKIPQIEAEILDVRVDAVKKVACVRVQKNGHFSKFAELAQRFGYEVRPIKPSENLELLNSSAKRDDLFRIAVVTVCAGNVMLLSTAVYFGADQGFRALFHWLSFALSVPVVILGFKPMLVSAIASVRSRVPTLDLPVVIAFGAGFLLSVVNLLTGHEEMYFDSLNVLILLILTSRYFVKRFQEKFLEYEGEASSILPIEAHLVVGENVHVVPAKKIQVGQIVCVRAGEVLPVDGIVIKGSASLNEAVLTGEATPRHCLAGSTVYAGTRLEMGELEVQAESIAEKTRMALLQSESISNALMKSHIQRTLELWTARFTYGVLFLGGVTLLYFTLQSMAGEGFRRALAVFIVACPCAMAFGAPIVFSRALSQLAARGIFVRTADIFEWIVRLKNVVFDKTGTLTMGKLKIIHIDESLDAKTIAAVIALEKNVIHPIAHSLVTELSAKFDEKNMPQEAEHVEVLSGRGVRGFVENQKLEILASDHEAAKGESIQIWLDVSVNDVLQGRICLEDQLRPEAKSIVQFFRDRALGLWILSGDRASNVERIGADLSLEQKNLFSRCSPEDKEARVRKISDVLMIGDGINDMRAMSKSMLSVVVGGVLKNVLKVADVFLVRDGIQELPQLFAIQKKVQISLSRIRFFSWVYNVGTALLAVAGFINPLTAALLMPLSSISVLMISYFSMKEDPWTSFG